MKQVRARLIDGPVTGTLARMAGGMMVGFLAGTGFHITDTYFVSRLGTIPLAAMSFTFPVVMLFGSLAMGIGVGSATVIARLIGRGEHEEVRHLTTDSLLLALSVASVMVVAGLLTIRPLFTLLGATSETLPYIEQYIWIWYVGAPFLMVPMVGNNAIRATGDTLWPSVVMLVDLGINIVLDPVLIFGLGPIPAMGVAGAALATSICHVLALGASLYILHRHKGMLAMDMPTVARLRVSWPQILHTAIPATGTQMLMPISAGLLLKMVAWSGTAAVAAFGAAGRIEMLAVLPLMALGASIVPFVGQNRGAQRFDRIREGHTKSYRFAVGWGLTMAVALALLASPIAGIFTKDPAVHYYLVLMMYLAPAAYGFKGMSMIANNGMNAIGYPYSASLMTVLRLFVFILPLSYAGARLGGFAGLVLAGVSAEWLAGAVATKWVLSLYDRRARHEIPVVPVAETV